MHRVPAAVLAALLGLAACSGDVTDVPAETADAGDGREATDAVAPDEDEVGGDDDAVMVDPVAPEVALDPTEEAFRASAPVLDPGQIASFSGELEVSVLSASVAGDRVEVVAALANPGDLPLQAPSVLVTCADGRGDAALDPGPLGGVIDPGARVEGSVTIGLPPDCDQRLVQVVAFTAGSPAQSVAYWSAEG